ncbi:MAG: aldehyde dehydrogenase [Bacteroidales bacterium]|jgi:aldehyde dehydrogenase (NAD+)|nr:aldehyde dehydrogenase [Bacteroidales bacterium]
MEATDKKTILERIDTQRNYFATGKSRDIAFRKEMLRRFRDAIIRNEKRITDALYHDLHKSYQEAYLTEISLVLSEISFHLSKLNRWAKPARVKTPLFLLPSSSRLIHEPLGVSLIIAPWNYPFQLLMNPLVGAISAGCTAILKPSPYTPAIAGVMEEIISTTFKPEYITTVMGGREVNSFLLEQRWDIIFFTGSPVLGKVVMAAASKNLTPLVLELGGKSPCIVDEGADIGIAARRIAWGKTINAGQTCIAPDYILVHGSLKEKLIEALGGEIRKTFGDDPGKSDWYPRMVSKGAFERVSGYISNGTVRFGGRTNAEAKYIEPTILDNIDPASPVMQDEIFGPVLPVLTYNTVEEAIAFINGREKPLALYFFGRKAMAREVLSRTSSGGGCLNDTLMHITNHHMPFGGVGNSGMGSYHGKESFLAFSNARAIVKTPTWIDMPFKYVPFKFFNLVRKIM